MIKLKDPPRFRDIPPFTRSPSYGIDIPWAYLEKHIDRETEQGATIDFDPDFQREHVWTDAKSQAYVEFCLRGGTSARNIYLNCPGFNAGAVDNYVLVDGKQRLTAIRMFMLDHLSVFGGHFYTDFEDNLNLNSPSIRWNVNDLSTRAEVLQWYLDLNTGGVLHTKKELDKVHALLNEELKRKD